MMSPGHQLCIGNASKYPRIGSLKQRHYYSDLSERSGACKPLVLVLLFIHLICHVGMMTFFRRRADDSKHCSISLVSICFHKFLAIPFRLLFVYGQVGIFGITTAIQFPLCNLYVIVVKFPIIADADGCNLILESIILPFFSPQKNKRHS